MRRTLLFVLALIAVGCAEGELEESASCVGLSVQSPLEDLRTCAEQGDADAQFDLGRRYQTGRDVPLDYAEAHHWNRLAAEQGLGIAQYILAGMYERGEGVPVDYAEAAHWRRLSAEQGDAAAQDAFGRMYGRGEGVPLDYVLAYMWFNIAASQGYGEDSQVSSVTVTGQKRHRRRADDSRTNSRSPTAVPRVDRGASPRQLAPIPSVAPSHTQLSTVLLVLNGEVPV